MKVKATASFFHGGSRKVGDEFEVSDRAGGLLEAKGLVELSAPLVTSSATDGLDGDSPKVAGSDTEGDATSCALDQGQVVANAGAATNEAGQPVLSPAADAPVGDSHQAGGLDTGLDNVPGTLEQNPDVVNADAVTKEDEAVADPAQAELVPTAAEAGKATSVKAKRSTRE